MTEVILITLLVVALFFIFFIRPARSEQQRRQQHLTELRIGDQVLTRGGLIAEVTDVETPDDGPMICSSPSPKASKSAPAPPPSKR